MVQRWVDRKSTAKKGHLGDIPVVGLDFGSSWAHHLWNLKNPTTISHNPQFSLVQGKKVERATFRDCKTMVSCRSFQDHH